MRDPRQQNHDGKAFTRRQARRYIVGNGRVAERFKAAVLKTARGATLS
jgi:hypothetical protein